MSTQDTNSSSSMTQYPNLNCYWDIYFGKIKVSASEVTGLKETVEFIPYRAGSSADNFSRTYIKRPQEQQITVKWAVFTEGYDGAHVFQVWRDERSYINDHFAIDVVVTLLNEYQDPVMYWVCRNCVPTEYLGPDLKGDKAEVAMQTLKISSTSIKSYYVHTSPSSYTNFLEKYKHDYNAADTDRWYDART